MGGHAAKCEYCGTLATPRSIDERTPPDENGMPTPARVAAETVREQPTPVSAPSLLGTWEFWAGSVFYSVLVGLIVSVGRVIWGVAKHDVSPSVTLSDSWPTTLPISLTVGFLFGLWVAPANQCPACKEWWTRKETGRKRTLKESKKIDSTYEPDESEVFDSHGKRTGTIRHSSGTLTTTTRSFFDVRVRNKCAKCDHEWETTHSESEDKKSYS